LGKRTGKPRKRVGRGAKQSGAECGELQGREYLRGSPMEVRGGTEKQGLKEHWVSNSEHLHLFLVSTTWGLATREGRDSLSSGSFTFLC